MRLKLGLKMPEGGTGVKRPMAGGGVGSRGGLDVGFKALVLQEGFKAASEATPPELGFKVTDEAWVGLSVMGGFRGDSLPRIVPEAAALPPPISPSLSLPTALLLADPPTPPLCLSILPPKVALLLLLLLLLTLLLLLPGAREEGTAEDRTGRLLLTR